MLAFFQSLSLTHGGLAAALLVSLLLAVGHALALTRGIERTFRWRTVIWSLAALTSVSMLTIDGLRWAADDQQSAIAPLPAILLLLLAMPLAWLHMDQASRPVPAEVLRRSPAAWGALVAALAMGGWASYRLQSELAPRDWNAGVTAARALQLLPETQYVGISDRGREIPLFRSASVSIDPRQAYHLEHQAQRPDRKNAVIARGVPDADSNCHGWVFAGGEFLLDAPGLTVILEDNGYAPCSAPQAGDVVVYFDHGDVPVHTGVVSGLLHDGTVIVESKWGIDGRYLHRPEDQPYSNSFAFYRSQRGGNGILVREANSALAKQRLPVPRRVRKA